MEYSEEIDIQLWEYIDGSCNNADRQRISTLIATDAAWKEQYETLLQLHHTIAADMELAEPSMRFSKNVMDAITTQHVAQVTKRYINPAIIRGIAAFFVVAIAAMLGYAITISGHSTSTSSLPKIDLDKLSISAFFNSSTFFMLLAVNIILALVLLDYILRRKHAAPQIDRD